MSEEKLAIQKKKKNQSATYFCHKNQRKSLRFEGGKLFNLTESVNYLGSLIWWPYVERI